MVARKTIMHFQAFNLMLSHGIKRYVPQNYLFFHTHELFIYAGCTIYVYTIFSGAYIL